MTGGSARLSGGRPGRAVGAGPAPTGPTGA